PDLGAGSRPHHSAAAARARLSRAPERGHQLLVHPARRLLGAAGAGAQPDRARGRPAADAPPRRAASPAAARVLPRPREGRAAARPRARMTARRIDPPKVLHIVGMLDRWAVENWLLRMLAHAAARQEPVNWTFYCANAVAGSRDEDARALGARVIHAPVPVGRKAAFARALRREVASGGYDVLHSHHDLISGVYLAAVAGVRIGRRIVHAHNADEDVLTPSALKQAIYRPLLRRLCLALGDRFVGNSEHSLRTLVGSNSLDPGRHHVNYYGMDPAPFIAARPDRCAFRRALGLAASTPLLL